MPGTHNSGRKRKSTAEHIRNGNPGHKNLEKERGLEPQWSVVEEVPKPPKIIKPPRKPALTGNEEIDQGVMATYEAAKFRAREAVKEWKRLAPELHEKGVLTKTGMQFFIAYCRACGQYAHAIHMQQTTNDGILLTNGKKISYMKVEQEALATIKWTGTELGLTPASASRVKSSPVPKKQESLGSFVNKSNMLHRVK